MDLTDSALVAVAGAGVAVLGLRRLLADRRAAPEGRRRTGRRYFLTLGLGLAVLVAVTAANDLSHRPVFGPRDSITLIMLVVATGSQWKLRKAVRPGR